VSGIPASSGTAGRGAAPPPLRALSGIGPAREERLARLGLQTVRDLLLLAPRRIDAEPEPVAVRDARARVGRRARVAGHLGGVRLHRSGRRRSILRAKVTDATGAIELLFFNQPWQRERLGALAAAGTEVEVAGLVVETRGAPALSAPRVGTPDAPLPPPGALRPVYPTTAGVAQGLLAGAIATSVAEHLAWVPEVLAPDALAARGLPALPDAVRELHAPRDLDAFLAARRRVALEPMLALQARLAARRDRGGPGSPGRARAIPRPADAAALFAPFGFRPTAAQVRCVEEILADMARDVPMRRLLQGDVGAGKTAVAVAAALAVAAAGGQVALLAPTEILAEQHHAALAEILARLGAPAVLVTGSLPAAARRAAEDALAGGAARIAIGTHALLSAGVRFQRLDLAVIDEQQRFGVAQRRALVDKGEDVHVLTMTATPIPRTLALTVYGDLAVSLLDELPPGRGAVDTLVLDPGERERVVAALAQRLEQGERAFWVAPRIADAAEDEDDPDDPQDPSGAEAAHRRLARRLGRHGVELVHGRLPADERAARIARFRRGDARLLVGTTVIEVGIDVPEATVLVVEEAERFGLAQLHQLRGRIGRGTRPGTCVLLARGEGAERAGVLARTQDGFAIAEEDLRRRGMGELAGLRQAGSLGDVLGAGDPEADVELLLFARDAVGDAAVRAHYLGL
jgi:ATP-dependent DNA helicase RecG